MPLDSASRLPRLLRRVAYFLVVWTALLAVHEAGHALTAWRQGHRVESVSVGIGPRLLSARIGGADVAVRLVPIAGITHVRADVGADRSTHSLGRTLAVLGGGIGATLLLGAVLAGAIVWVERTAQRRWLLGRFVVADVAVLTAFNLLPVPPLDGGRAMLDVLATVRGAPLAGDTLLLVQAGGFALALVPMLFWTRWTARIDAAALRWGVPHPR
jgi:membrane-associated protease RseP (regulator of RpoE activity)